MTDNQGSPIYEYTIVVAGPSDTNRDRQEVFKAIDAWNAGHSRYHGIRLAGIGWENVPPSMGEHPQTQVNRYFASRKYRALIALFRTKLGEKTLRADSGTVEEIESAMEACPNVLVYFYKGGASVPDIDTKQLSRLNRFKRAVSKSGFLGSYTSRPDLRAKLDQHIADLAYKLKEQAADHPVEGDPSAPDQASRDVRDDNRAILKILPRDDESGLWMYKISPMYQSADVKFWVQNIGKAPARDITCWVAFGDGPAEQGTMIPLLPSLAKNRLGFVLRLPAPFPGGTDSPVPEDYPDSDVIKVILRYSDFQHELGEQETEPVCFRFKRVQDRARWRAVSESCEATQTRGSYEITYQRPRNLTLGEHQILSTLVQRVSENPNLIRPVILTRRAGGNKTEYHSDYTPDASLSNSQVAPLSTERDFLPDLVSQGFVYASQYKTHVRYSMDESLFRAYGLPSPFE
jgi:hypothetical protein